MRATSDSWCRDCPRSSRRRRRLRATSACGDDHPASRSRTSVSVRLGTRETILIEVSRKRDRYNFLRKLYLSPFRKKTAPLRGEAAPRRKRKPGPVRVPEAETRTGPGFGSDALDDQRDALSAADAERREPELTLRCSSREAASRARVRRSHDRVGRWPPRRRSRFTRTGRILSSASTPRDWAAKASLSSHRPMSPSDAEALGAASRKRPRAHAHDRRSTPAAAAPRMIAIGVSFSAFARASDMITSAAAPSLMPDALPPLPCRPS